MLEIWNEHSQTEGEIKNPPVEEKAREAGEDNASESSYYSLASNVFTSDKDDVLEKIYNELKHFRRDQKREMRQNGKTSFIRMCVFAISVFILYTAITRSRSRSLRSSCLCHRGRGRHRNFDY